MIMCDTIFFRLASLPTIRYCSRTTPIVAAVLRGLFMLELFPVYLILLDKKRDSTFANSGWQFPA